MVAEVKVDREQVRRSTPSAEDMKRLAREGTWAGQHTKNAQFEALWAGSQMAISSLKTTGKFSDVLNDSAHMISRNDPQLTQVLAEKHIREFAKFQLRGQSLKEVGDALYKNEERVFQDSFHQEEAGLAAQEVARRIKDGPAPFYKSSDDVAVALAKRNEITVSGAQKMMSDAFKREYGKDFYAECKALETEHYKPVMEQEIAERRAAAEQTRSRSRS